VLDVTFAENNDGIAVCDPDCAASEGIRISGKLDEE
jgi:hypothetical protein